MRYTYSDEEDGGSDAPSIRQSNRQSGMSTPGEPAGPTFTASGRQVRSRHGGAYGEATLSGRHETGEQSAISGQNGAEGENQEPASGGRSRRATQLRGVYAKTRPRKYIDGYNSVDEMEDESDATTSGHEWDGGDDDEADDQADDGEDDEDVEMSDDEISPAEGNDAPDLADTNRSLLVSLRIPKGRSSTPQQALSPIGSAKTTESKGAILTVPLLDQKHLNHPVLDIKRDSTLPAHTPENVVSTPSLPFVPEAAASTNPQSFVFDKQKPPQAPEYEPIPPPPYS